MPSYFDHNATTHLDPRVLEAMQPYLSGPAANASSLHRYGRIARDAVELARSQVARLVACQDREVVWTSGGTEANNLALKGLAGLSQRDRLLYGASEHPSVMEAAEALVAASITVESIAVDSNGELDWSLLEPQVRAGRLGLISVMRANNEQGVIQDVSRVAELAHSAGALLHVDAVQAAGKIPVDVAELGADLLSVSSHKIYGPKGCGALVVRRHVEIAPILHGGAQERGLRGGTENVAAIVGFGAAAELALDELERRAEHVLALREQLEEGLCKRQDIVLFGRGARRRLPNTLQFAVAGWEGEALLMALDRKGFAVSSGSACASGSGEPSHVLLAMGLDRETAKSAVRVSFGKDNTSEQVEAFLAALDQIAPPR